MLLRACRCIALFAARYLAHRAGVWRSRQPGALRSRAHAHALAPAARRMRDAGERAAQAMRHLRRAVDVTRQHCSVLIHLLARHAKCACRATAKTNHLIHADIRGARGARLPASTYVLLYGTCAATYHTVASSRLTPGSTWHP